MEKSFQEATTLASSSSSSGGGGGAGGAPVAGDGGADTHQPPPAGADQEAAAPPERVSEAASSFGPPPDGGTAAWLAVLGGFCTVFASFGWINCIGIFQDYYKTNLLKQYSPSTVAWIPSTESFMLFFWGPLVGKLTDELGPRIPILIGSFLHIFGLMMTSISTQYYQIFLAQSVCSAVGCSFLFYAPIAAIGTWFQRHRALAFGVVTAGSSIGGVVLPIMVSRLVDAVGFGWSMRCAALLLLALLAVGNLTVKSRLPPQRRKFSVRDFLAPFSERPFLLLSVGGFVVYLGGFLPFNFIIAQAKAGGMSPGLAPYMVSIVNAASSLARTFGRILPAHFGDRYGVFNVMIVFSLLSAVFTLAVWLPARSEAGGLIAFAVLYGFTSGCTLSIIPAMVASISPDISKLGSRNGSLYACAAVGVLFGNPIAGAIVNRQQGEYTGLILFCGIALLVGTVFVVLARHALVGPQIRVKV
ncbi:monocarboxylate permease-like protein [Cordyceps fumosorosea ARSEF 2679]|uniref:Monocarboxylate permease-like protein n=1 Tax=Cordyceps fumosorosea (strain ARSEF 2679) TaxID=1081104 RepID=A0A162I9F6_CORFA|nr:monocarboxylate permease-like protein [Cordyceps fumosorosea ARSEF 2679]OAA54055.1 monocarboxylate permease-like protein [Cordyceps fumosorosea ARSEF 2679]